MCSGVLCRSTTIPTLAPVGLIRSSHRAARKEQTKTEQKEQKRLEQAEPKEQKRREKRRRDGYIPTPEGDILPHDHKDSRRARELWQSLLCMDIAKGIDIPVLVLDRPRCMCTTVASLGYADFVAIHAAAVMRGNGEGAVIVDSGLMHLYREREILAVMCHELAHVYYKHLDQDILVAMAKRYLPWLGSFATFAVTRNAISAVAAWPVTRLTIPCWRWLSAGVRNIKPTNSLSAVP